MNTVGQQLALCVRTSASVSQSVESTPFIQGEGILLGGWKDQKEAGGAGFNVILHACGLEHGVLPTAIVISHTGNMSPLVGHIGHD